MHSPRSKIRRRRGAQRQKRRRVIRREARGPPSGAHQEQNAFTTQQDSTAVWSAATKTSAGDSPRGPWAAERRAPGAKCIHHAAGFDSGVERSDKNVGG